MSVPSLSLAGRLVPPDWALQQRNLMTQMERAAVTFIDRYTRPDGTLIWRDEWPGMDGSDDGYESFLSFPLFYLLGGSEDIHALSRALWDAVTWQFTQYGQIHREFDAYYDWMHHGESYTYTYYFGLANPYHHIDRTRALNFAAMYIGEDPEAPNWDPEHKMMRSPINGSRGPIFDMSGDDWETHRWVLANYLSPYEDVPGLNSDDPAAKADWNDDETYANILKLMNERMVPGDIPMNLNATSLVSHAFMYTGEEKYREWVTDYLTTWITKTEENGGIIPDNIGPNGKIGEKMDGKWWGGYYGWRWPHGAMNALEATLIAGMNARLLTGDSKWLDLCRSQLDMLWEKRREEDGVMKVPWKHGDAGWFDYRPMRPDHYINLYFATMDPQDLHRLETVFPDYASWKGSNRFVKGGGSPAQGWFAYVQGHNPNYPMEAANNTWEGMTTRLRNIDQDDDDVDSWDVHHWQNLNPVLPESLLQVAMGSPGAVYHGGLLHAALRYFDPDGHRPGLPDYVSAAVECIDPEGVTLHLVNTDPIESRDVLIQAGAFAEHAFTGASVEQPETDVNHGVDVTGRLLNVSLAPGTHAVIRLDMDRYTNSPTYDFPTFH